MHHVVTDKARRAAHLGHGLLRGAHQGLDLAANLLHQAHDLPGGIRQQGKGNQGSDGSKDHKDIDQGLADEKGGDNDDDKKDETANGSPRDLAVYGLNSTCGIKPSISWCPRYTEGLRPNCALFVTPCISDLDTILS